MRIKPTRSEGAGQEAAMLCLTGRREQGKRYYGEALARAAGSGGSPSFITPRTWDTKLKSLLQKAKEKKVAAAEGCEAVRGEERAAEINTSQDKHYPMWNTSSLCLENVIGSSEKPISVLSGPSGDN